FTGLALLMAAQNGRLDLDAPATDIVPDLPVRNPWRETHPLRIAHLIEHTAGLPDLSREEFDHSEPMELRAALAWKANGRRCLWPPGMHHSYTNAGAGLAALVLEEATGQSYEDFVEQRIFVPLGMETAGFFPDPPTLEALATGYDSDGYTVIPYWHMLYRAFGAINARPVEMAALLQMLLNRGIYRGRRLLSASAVDRMETPATTLAARSGLRYGYGLGNYAWLHNGVLFHGHGGDGDGYLSRLGYSRERNLGYFVVINVFRNPDLDHFRDLIEDFIADGAQPDQPPRYDPSADSLSRLAGNYESVTSRFPGNALLRAKTITLRQEGMALFIDRNGRTRRLVPVNDRHFRYEDETVATSAFIMDHGKTYFQDDGGNYLKMQEAAGTDP
ncbi:MAG: serine hydrolase domain-containing protein, partial [Gammaproteobacteria bacterium]